jgi:hypothetical protein
MLSSSSLNFSLNTIHNDYGKNELISGKNPLDRVVYRASGSDYRVAKLGQGQAVINIKTGEEDILSDIERVKFNDKAIAFDTDGSAGKAYRIYRAAFARDPQSNDKVGLGYWIFQIDNGMDIIDVASRFIDSHEFRARYGGSLTNSEFLEKIYVNVLSRSPDEAGFNWWLNQMNTNPQKSRAKVLSDFSESVENKLAASQLIQNGINFSEYIALKKIIHTNAYKFWENSNIYSFFGDAISWDPIKYGGDLPLLASADFNGDGHSDLLFGYLAWTHDFIKYDIVNQFAKGNLYIGLFNPSDHAYQIFPEKAIPAMYWTQRPVVGDFNKDSFIDLFVAGTGPDQGEPRGEKPVLMLGSKDGLIDASYYLPRANVYTHQIAYGDFNNDKKIDFFLINNPWIKESTAKLISESSGSAYEVSSHSSLVLSSEIGWSEKPISNAYINPKNTKAGWSYGGAIGSDYDNDGNLDVILQGGNFNDFAYKTMVLRGNGRGEFAGAGEMTAKPFGDLSVGAALQTHDFDGDGIQEIIQISTRHNGAAAPWSGAAFNIFSQDKKTLAWNDVTSTYVPTGDFSNGEPEAWVKAIYFLDLDDDGDKDILLSTMAGVDGSRTGAVMPRLFVNNSGFFTPQNLGPFDLSGFGHLLPISDENGTKIIGSSLNFGLQVFEAYF